MAYLNWQNETNTTNRERERERDCILCIVLSISFSILSNNSYCNIQTTCIYIYIIQNYLDYSIYKKLQRSEKYCLDGLMVPQPTFRMFVRFSWPPKPRLGATNEEPRSASLVRKVPSKQVWSANLLPLHLRIGIVKYQNGWTKYWVPSKFQYTSTWSHPKTASAFTFYQRRTSTAPRPKVEPPRDVPAPRRRIPNPSVNCVQLETPTLPFTIMEVENGCPSNIRFLSFGVIFHFHDYGRKIVMIIHCHPPKKNTKLLWQ